MMTADSFKLKIPLIISALVVIPAAFIYGFKPDALLDIQFQTNDEFSFAKGITGLYLAFSVLWCIGIFNARFLRAALLSNCLFMLGLGFGRILGVMFNGWPTDTYIVGMVGELILGFYSAFVLNSNKGRELS